MKWGHLDRNEIPKHLRSPGARHRHPAVPSRTRSAGFLQGHVASFQASDELRIGGPRLPALIGCSENTFGNPNQSALGSLGSRGPAPQPRDSMPPLDSGPLITIRARKERQRKAHAVGGNSANYLWRLNYKSSRAVLARRQLLSGGVGGGTVSPIHATTPAQTVLVEREQP